MDLLNATKRQTGRKISSKQLERIGRQVQLKPLRIVGIHYGSPVSIDLLGISSLLTFVQDTVKDLVWRGQHEKEMAELERKGKAEQIRQSKLETTKLAADVILKRLEVIEKTQGLALSKENYDRLVKDLIPQLTVLVDPPNNRLLYTHGQQKHLPRSKPDK